MSSRKSPLRIAALVACLATLTLAGCGRRGALEMPVDQAKPAAKPASDQGMLGEGATPQSKPEAPKHPLILDNLL